MPKFCKRPVVIEAIQLLHENWSELSEFLAPFLGSPGPEIGLEDYLNGDDELEIIIPTREGDMTAREGCWIIKGVEGEFYPCDARIFEQTYEEVK